MSEEGFNAHNPSPHQRGAQSSNRVVGIEPGDTPRFASMLPLIVLYQRAWELTHATELSLGRLEHAAEAAALAEAVLHLLAEADDQAGHARWAVRLSEARHWCTVVHDALTCREARES